MRTSNLTIPAIAVIATLAAMPAVAANSAKDLAKPAPIKHMTMRHQASLQARENRLSPRGVANPRDVNANLNLSNANASANRPAESLATQLGATVTKSGDASDPVCKPGDVVPMPDGKMHPCQ